MNHQRSNFFGLNKPSYSQFKVLTSALYFHHLHLRLFTLHFPAIFSFLQSLKITVFENQISGHLKQVLLASLLLKSICFLRSDATYLPLWKKNPISYLHNVKCEILMLHDIFLFAYIVSMENVYYDFLYKHPIVFCMLLKGKSKYSNSKNSLFLNTNR